jgi:hypothetical protein
MVTISQKLKSVGASVGGKISSALPSSVSKAVTSAGQALYSVAKYIPPVKLAVEKPAVSLSLAAAGVGIAAVGVPATITGTTAVAKAAIKHPKQTVIAAVAAPAVYGVVKQTGTFESAKAIAKAPSELAQFGGDVANLAQNPSLESAKQLIQESPIISTAVAAAGALALGKALVPAVVATQQTSAIKEQTEAIKGATAGYVVSPSGTEGVLPLSPSVPVTPPTKTVEAGTQRRRRRIKAKTTTGNITQRVNVLVSNRNAIATKKYIRRNVLAY